MNTEHVCKWKMWADGWGRIWAMCNDPDCKLSLSEVERRLNEYETLKAATEMLTAEMARNTADSLWSGDPRREDKMTKDLRAYANILDGKDGYSYS